MNVSVLGFGGAEIGYTETPQGIVDQLLNAALDAGLNVIDTAECYRGSEVAIGNAVSHRRDDYYLFTKCGHASGLDMPDWDPEMLALSIDRSLERLKTDHVDLIQLHTCGEDVLRKGDVIDVIQRAKEAGKTRYIGYSGDGNDARYAVECGAFDALQTSVNIADQEAIETTLPVARRKGMGIIAKRPIANVAWREEPPAGAYRRIYWERLNRLKYAFLEGDIPSSVATALKFTLAHQVDVAIVGTEKPDRWKTNARSLSEGPLAPDIIAEIRSRWKEIAPPDWVGQG